MKLKDLVKIAAPIAIGSIAPGLMPGMNPVLARGLASGVGSLVMGGKPKDALLAGALGAGVGAMFPGQQAGAEQLSGSNLAPGAMGGSYQSKAAANAATKIPSGDPPGGSGFGALKGTAPLAESKTMSGGLLQSLGFAGEDEGNVLFKILNSKLGEGVAAGLIAQLLAGDDDDEVVGEFERRPFGAGGPGGKLGGINYAQGGAVPQLQQLSQVSAEMADKISNLAGGIAQGVNQQGGMSDFGIPSTMPVKTMFGAGDGRLRAQPVPYMARGFEDGGSTYFPRRNGGIDPAEGSGKKDDVPAMLMAGEFVMTRDAVKGMGDGNLRKGIDRMYGMMDNLERMA